MEPNTTSRNGTARAVAPPRPPAGSGYPLIVSELVLSDPVLSDIVLTPRPLEVDWVDLPERPAPGEPLAVVPPLFQRVLAAETLDARVPTTGSGAQHVRVRS